jgi:hypothetical protein
MMDLPTFSACTRSASFSTAKCADIVGLETLNWSLSSPAQVLQLAAVRLLGKGFEHLAPDSTVS